ncbi:hypothetical protein [uncultured Chryseobacterium sp.]|uniref:hypothetical protein n=1 Tax=uncultured Chryseobacterium sp. TaxID=259322 RepID=UPI0025D8ADB9|nr:hypothetical protein [uncultured Chryseobacterium sp.]
MLQIPHISGVDRKKSELCAPGAYGAVRARAYSKGQFSDHSWEKGKLTKDNKPAYGATAMIVWDGGGQHVAFVIEKIN